jgi:hypothetical protein
MQAHLVASGKIKTRFQRLLKAADDDSRPTSEIIIEEGLRDKCGNIVEELWIERQHEEGVR